MIASRGPASSSSASSRSGSRGERHARTCGGNGILSGPSTPRTSCPPVRRISAAYEPIWPVTPVMRTRAIDQSGRLAPPSVVALAGRRLRGTAEDARHLALVLGSLVLVRVALNDHT